MAVIWAMVLILPNQLTLTAPEAPTLAIHSRRAETVISRPMMTRATSMSHRSRPTRATSAALTKPSSASVMAAMTNISMAVAFFVPIVIHVSGR